MGQDRTTDAFDDYAALLASSSITGRRLSRTELEPLREFGEEAAGDGSTLRSLIVQHIAEIRAAWPGLPGTPDDVLSAVQQTVEALCEGYERAQRFAVRQQEAARREFIDDLLYARSDLGRLAERAERFGLQLSHAHAVAVAQGPAPTQRATRYQGVSNARSSAGSGNAGSCSPPRRVCSSASPPATRRTSSPTSPVRRTGYAATDGGRTAIGRTHRGAGGVVHSYEEARSALDLAGRLELEEPVLHASNLLVYPVLTRDRQAMADLVHTTLGPLLAARGGPEPFLQTLTAYFDAGCVAAEAARRLALSVRALTYRLVRIHQLTGSDPTDPRHR